MKRMMRLLSLALCLMLVQQTAFAAIPEDYVVRHGDRESKKIAITVDDGWNMDAVYKIHELSIELDFPVTWFIVGKLFCAEDRELWEDALAHGDEFGSHTWKHAQLLEYSESSADAQVRLSLGHYMNSEKNFLPIFMRMAWRRSSCGMWRRPNLIRRSAIPRTARFCSITREWRTMSA